LAYSLLTLVRCSSLLLLMQGLSRRRAGRAGACLALFALAAGGGCYTNPINRAPSVSISPVGEIFRRQTATFTVDATDPDADALTIGWAWREGDCPDFRDHLTWPKADMEGPLEVMRTFTVSPVPDGLFCVWAFATDRHQAVTPINGAFAPRNQAPVPSLTLSSPDLAPTYPLYTTFAFRGAAADAEGDSISFTWELANSPTGFSGGLVPCDDSFDDVTRCLRADVPGRYVVSLSAFDGTEISVAPATRMLDVLPDRPPCIARTSPPYNAIWAGDPASDDAIFRVISVDDDGDAQDLHYVWYYARVDEPWNVAVNDFPELNLRDTFREGDIAEVRVEIHDRPNKGAIDNALLMCDAQNFCAVQAGSGCFQRVTWMVRWTR
jgi:hypothetical protein